MNLLTKSCVAIFLCTIFFAPSAMAWTIDNVSIQFGRDFDGTCYYLKALLDTMAFLPHTKTYKSNKEYCFSDTLMLLDYKNIKPKDSGWVGIINMDKKNITNDLRFNLWQNFTATGLSFDYFGITEKGDIVASSANIFDSWSYGYDPRVGFFLAYCEVDLGVSKKNVFGAKCTGSRAFNDNNSIKVHHRTGMMWAALDKGFADIPAGCTGDNNYISVDAHNPGVYHICVYENDHDETRTYVKPEVVEWRKKQREEWENLINSTGK